MDEVALLTSLTLFTLLAGICSIIFNKLRLPPLIGYLVSGILIANLWEVGHDGEYVVNMLSDMGLVMLMFCIGLEINLKKIRKQGVFAIEVAVIQLPLMVLGGYLGGTLLGFNMLQSICLGAIISGSSTAVVMAVLKSQNRLDKETVETLVLITIMEDIGQVIILSMITPMLAGSSMDVNDLAVMIISIVAFMLVSIFLGLKFIPRIVNWVSDNVSSEVLIVFCVGLAFGMALLSTFVGLSMAIGAFLMGMIIAACRKSREINHDIGPMKDLFMAMFFISVGMEVSVSGLVDNIGLVLIFYLLFAVMKSSTVFLAYWIGNEKAYRGFVSAVSLVTMGEFAFIIAKEALDYGVVDNSFYTAVIGAALLSMIVLPFLTRYSDPLWFTAEEKCPPRIREKIDMINHARDNMYRRVTASSKKSQRAFTRGMTKSYINLVMIAIVEVAFFFLIPLTVDWLTESFGATEFIWTVALLVLNFVMLSLPTYQLVNNVKYLDELVIKGAKLVSMEGKADEPGRAYQNFLELNSFLIVLVIDALILIVVPNPLGMKEHILVIALAVIAVSLFYYRSQKKAHSDPDDDESEMEDVFED